MSNPLTVGRAYPANWPLGPKYKEGGYVPNAEPPHRLDLPGEMRIPCPADPVLSAEGGSPSGQRLLGPALEAYLIPLLKAMAEQTAAINRLAISNEALVQAMAEGQGVDDDEQPRAYLNGSPVR